MSKENHFRREVLAQTNLNKKWEDVRMKTPTGGRKDFVRPPDKEQARQRGKLERIDDEAWEMLNKVTCLKSEISPDDKERLDMEKIGSGWYRRAYKIGEDTDLPLENPTEVVIKVIKKNYNDEWANEEEVKTWLRLKGTSVEEHLAPILDFGENYHWVAQPKLETGDVEWADMDEIRDKCIEKGWKYTDWGEPNCGYTPEGKTVLLDYGYDNNVTDEKLLAD